MLEAQAVQHAREIEYGVATQLVCGAGQLREAAIGVARHCSPSCRARQPYAEGAAAPQKWARRAPCARHWASSVSPGVFHRIRCHVVRTSPLRSRLLCRPADHRRGGAGLDRADPAGPPPHPNGPAQRDRKGARSEEHTSELQSPCNLVCRLLLEKKKKIMMQEGVVSME